MCERIEPSEFNRLMNEINIDSMDLLNKTSDNITEKDIQNALEKDLEFYLVYINYGHEYSIRLMLSDEEELNNIFNRIYESCKGDEVPSISYVAFEELAGLYCH